MHFVFGPCSTIVASEKGENIIVWGLGGYFRMLEVLLASLCALSDVKHGVTLL